MDTAPHRLFTTTPPKSSPCAFRQRPSLVRETDRGLLEHCIDHLTRSGFAAITLTVTEANHKAVKLYQDAGFFIRHRFDAMVLDKS